MRLIDADALYKKTAELESLAMETLKVQEDNAEWQRWQTILGERTAFKFDVADAPTIDAVPVVRCWECRYAREPNRMDRDERLACEGVLVCCVGFDHVYPSSDDGLIFVDGSGFCSYGERKDGAE